MTKNELVAEVARRTGATRKEVTDMMESVNEVVMDQVKKGEPVYFGEIGKFAPKHREEKKGRNPSTGESLIIPAKNVVVFKASTSFEKFLN